MTSTPASPATETPPPPRAGADPSPRSLTRTALWLILGLVLLADALDMIDSTVTNIAAPTVVRDIGGGQTLIKWLGSAYALAMGVLLVVGGRLGDKFGQRRLFLIGITGFTAASALCGLAPDPGLLIVARAIQGAFGALLIPQGMAIMTKTFPRDMMRKAFNLFGPMLGVATMGGPVLAGFLIDADLGGLSWRPIFLVNLVLGTFGTVAALRLLPRDRSGGAEPAPAEGQASSEGQAPAVAQAPSDGQHTAGGSSLGGDRSLTVDGLGSGLLAVTMFGLMFGLIEGSTNGWGVLPVLSLAVGAGFLLLFARRQRTAANPLIKPTLLKNRGFTSGMLVGLLFFAVTSGLVYVVSLFMQQALHSGPGDAALGLLPLTIGIIIAAGTCMALTQRLGRTLILIGMLVTLVGGGWLLALVLAHGTHLGLWTMAPAILVTGLGMGTCFGTIYDIALGDIAPDEAGSAGGSLTAVQQLANGIGSATVTTIYFHFGDPAHAMTASLITVLAVTAACLPALRLLPRNAPPEPTEAPEPAQAPA